MDVIPVIVNIVAGESAFDKSCEEEMSEMSSKEYPVRVKKKKSGKGGWKIITTSDKRKRQMQLVDKDVSAFLLALEKETSLQTTTQSSNF